jgi:hypothetical protein
VPAQATRRETERDVEKVVTGLLNQVGKRRSPCQSHAAFLCPVTLMLL